MLAKNSTISRWNFSATSSVCPNRGASRYATTVRFRCRLQYLLPRRQRAEQDNRGAQSSCNSHFQISHLVFLPVHASESPDSAHQEEGGRNPFRLIGADVDESTEVAAGAVDATVAVEIGGVAHPGPGDPRVNRWADRFTKSARSILQTIIAGAGKQRIDTGAAN